MAGGFAAGFGTAFADSFNTAYENRKAQEHDTFQTYYKAYLDKQSKDEDWKRKQGEMVNAAKTLAAGSGAPAESWEWVYGQLQAGASPNKINDMLSSGTFEIKDAGPSDTSGAATPDNDLTKNAQTTTDAQMVESGMTPPKAGGIFGQFNQGMQDKFNAKIAKQQGVDPETIAKSMSTADIPSEPLAGASGKSIKYIPGPSIDLGKINSINEAIGLKQWAASKGNAKYEAYADQLIEKYRQQDELEKQNNVNFVNPTMGAIYGDKPNTWNGIADKRGDKWFNRATGEEVSSDMVRGYGKQELEAFDKLADKTAEPREKFEASRGNLISMARTTGQLYDLAKEVPEGLDLSGDISMTVDRYLKGAKNVLSILSGSNTSDLIKSDGSVNTDLVNEGFKTLTSAEKKLEAQFSSVTDRNERVALAATLMRIKQQKLAYQYGMAMGQEGRSLDQREQERFMQSAAGNGRVDAILATAADYTREAYENTVRMQKGISREGDLRMAPMGNIPLPVPLAEDVDQYIQTNEPDLVERINQYKNLDPVDFVKKSSPQKEEPVGIPDGWEKIDPENANIDSQMLNDPDVSEATKDIIRRKYGK